MGLITCGAGIEDGTGEQNASTFQTGRVALGNQLLPPHRCTEGCIGCIDFQPGVLQRDSQEFSDVMVWTALPLLPSLPSTASARKTAWTPRSRHPHTGAGAIGRPPLEPVLHSHQLPGSWALHPPKTLRNVPKTWLEC